MNFLGHAFFSFGDAEILTGNMIGDFVKGKAMPETFPEKIKKGIMLHRRIDTYTDMDAAILRARVLFRQDYGLYAAPIVDIVFDHFLATDPHWFRNENALLGFSQDVYKKLEQHSSYFPAGFAAIYPYMRQHDWLYNYRTVMGVKRSLQGLQRRAKYMPDADKAYNSFIQGYYQLNQSYFEFIEKAYKFVNTELIL